MARPQRFELEPFCGRERGESRAGVRRRNPDPAERERDLYNVAFSRKWRALRDSNLSRFAGVSEARAERESAGEIPIPQSGRGISITLLFPGNGAPSEIRT